MSKIIKSSLVPQPIAILSGTNNVQTILKSGMPMVHIIEQSTANTVTTEKIALQGEKGNIGLTGATGDSAYEEWIALGNIGTPQDFINSLKGPKGDTGDSVYADFQDFTLIFDNKLI